MNIEYFHLHKIKNIGGFSKCRLILAKLKRTRILFLLLVGFDHSETLIEYKEYFIPI